MKRISSWLEPGGLLFVQILCHREFAYEFKAKEGSTSEWMSEHFFTGGTMPSDDLLLYFQDDMKILGRLLKFNLFVRLQRDMIHSRLTSCCMIVDHWRLSGVHYQKTLDAWLEILDSKQDSVRKIFQEAYGIASAESHLFDWQLFFLYTSEAFGFDGGNEWIVAQYLFSGQLRSSL
jgi:cyclopropane fatty-acyl-phospholipid synthase-like methyltransferase